jgi:hypothetical protein
MTYLLYLSCNWVILCHNKCENEPTISISFIAFKTSSLLLQNRVVSSASCEIWILWFFHLIWLLNLLYLCYYFRFNESFISWVKTLYSDLQTCVMNNGWVSENFKNSRGIRQDVLYQHCYLIPPLFCFYLTINLKIIQTFLFRSLPLRHLLYYCNIGL